MVVPGALYAIAILIAGVAPVVSLWIYAGPPIMYFAAVLSSRASAPPGAAEPDFT
jgi:hypothetical protein